MARFKFMIEPDGPRSYLLQWYDTVTEMVEWKSTNRRHVLALLKEARSMRRRLKERLLHAEQNKEPPG